MMFLECGTGNSSFLGVEGVLPDPRRTIRNRRMEQDYREEALGLIKGTVILSAPMNRYTSIKVGGPADALLFPKDLEELKAVVRHAKRRRIPILLLGNGTNLIVRDGGLRGWVVSLVRGLKKVQTEGEVLECEAGVPLQRVVRTCMEAGLSGFEPFFGIPGSIGGALAMNAGAWGVEIKDLVLSVTCLNSAGRIVERDRPRLKFGYRHLDIPASWIILKGRFQLKRGKREKIHEAVKGYSQIRRRTQPLGCHSAGSIFKNPKEGPAGKWIEEAGLKGFRMGQAMVSERHANFIVNLGKARAEDILQVIDRVEKQVYEQKGISLQREVRVVGE
jgi:UDP-N-acetylmuramate dehydrogenase